jgi:energy-coupling factor transport system ATP-binding protein
LSGGERRKVGLAGVIALKPRILLLDEPTAGLDPEAHDDLLSRLAKLKEEGMTLVVATHNMDDVAFLADRVLVLNEGRIVLQGSTRSVFSKVSELRSYGLDAPTYVAFVARLKAEGWDISRDVLSLEETEAAVLDAVKAERSKQRGDA